MAALFVLSAVVVSSNVKIASADTWTPTSATIITKSSSSANVKWLQSTLNAVQNAGLTVDGFYGKLTTAAIKIFQAANPSAGGVDGIAGKHTIAALNIAGSGSSTGGFSAGCTSASGFSATTGSPCTSVNATTFVPPGCTNSSGFIPVTGGACHAANSNTTLAPAGCTNASGFSPVTGGACYATVSGAPVVTSGPLSVSLASDNPAPGTVLSGQALANLAHFTFTGTGTLSQVTLQRTGLSVSADLDNVYLFNGNTRLTDGASVNTAGNVVFNNVNIPVNGSITLSVKADIHSTISSVTLGMTLTSFEVSGSTTPTIVNIAGNLFNVSTAPTGGTSATLNATTVSTANVNAGSVNYPVWSNGLQVNGRAGSLIGLNLHYVGSAPYDAVQNLKLYIDGVLAGSSSGVASNGYAMFDFGSAPIALSVSTHTIEVRGDILKGSNRNFQFSLQNASDLMITDSQNGININAASAVANGAAGTITVNAGSVTVTIDPAFNTITTVTGGATNVPIAQYKFSAYGEDMKITSLTVTPTIASGAPATTSMNNVALYANGGQIGTSQNYTGTALVYSLGSSLIIPAGTTTIVTVKADTINATPANYTAGTLTVLLAGSTNNAQGMSSQNLTTSPATTGVTSSALTIAAASATVAVSTSLNAQNVISNTPKTLIGSYVIQAGSSEGVRVNSLKVGLVFPYVAPAYVSGTVTSTGSQTLTVTTGSAVNFAVGDVITIPGGTAAIGTVTAVPTTSTVTVNITAIGATPSGTITGDSGPMTLTNVSNLYTSDDTTNITGNPSATNTYSVNYTLAPSTSKTINIYADLGGLNAGQVNTTLQITAVGATSNVALTGTGLGSALTGQVMTVAAGSLATPTLTTSSTVSQFVIGGSTPPLATYNFVATNGNATITELKFTTTGDTAAIDHVCIGTVCAPVVSGVADVAGLNLVVPAGYAGSNILVNPTYSAVGIGQQASNSVATMTLTYMKYTIGNTTTTNTTVSVASNAMDLVATKPTVTATQPSGVVLGIGAVEAIDVTVAADSAGSITLKDLPITSTLSAGTGTPLFTAGAIVVKDANNATVATTGSCTSAATCAATIAFTGGYTVAAGQSQTFKVFLPVAALGTGTLPNTYMYTSPVASSAFSWTDVSGNATITNTTYVNNYPSTFTSSIHN